jgi:hypothetical protein
MTELPLSDRVHAPVELQPAPVAGIAWRSAGLDDLDAVVALYAAISRVDHPDWTETRDEIEQEFTQSWSDLQRDTLIGESDGVPVAFGQVIWMLLCVKSAAARFASSRRSCAGPPPRRGPLVG